MIDRETGLWIYNKMNEIRDFEETAWTLFTENKLRGSVHLYTGEEAVAASVCAQLTDEDYIASTHRGHGHCIAKGAELDRALAELMGKATGYCKGRSGSMHIADFSKGNLGANAIVGGGIPIATGGGLAIKMQNRKNVSVAFFGDGASNQGTFHESINLAAVWKLPVIYVCENNQFGMTVPTWQSTSVENIADRAAGYGIPGEVVDGNDVVAVYEAFARAKERALKGEGPTLLECKTYRWRGHWTGDPEPYRTREEVEEWKEKRDPIKLFRAYLTRHKLATKQELVDIIGRLRREIPDIFLRTTLISGFPGETQEDHEELMEFVDEIEFDRLGVFPYSAEEDTPAATMEDQIPEEVKEARRDEIMELQQEISLEKGESRVGQVLTVMIEGKVSGESAYIGRTYGDAPKVDGYIFVQTGELLMTGDFARVRVTGALEYDLIGELEDEYTE